MHQALGKNCEYMRIRYIDQLFKTNALSKLWIWGNVHSHTARSP